MNKKERKELADQVRIAAWGVEVDHNFTCNALTCLQVEYETERAVVRLYRELFMPNENAHDKPWFGPLSLKGRVGEPYLRANNTEAQDHRVVALCLLAAIIETEGV